MATLRFWLTYVGEANLSEAQRGQVMPKRVAGEAALQLMDAHLATRDWMVGAGITLADIALYAYTHVCEGGAFRLSDYRHIGRWLDRVVRQPGYVAMI